MSDYESVLADIPDDWTTATIEGLGSVVSGGTPSREIASYWGGSIPWVTPGEVTTLKEKTFRLTSESITKEGLRQSGANLLPAGSLLVTTRASLGYCAINSVPVTTNQGFKSIVFRQSSNPDFYYHWTRKVSPELKRRASGTTFLEISGSDFKQIKFPVPPSAEQQTIAQILDTLDTQIQKTEALIAKLEKIKEGLLHDLLTRGIDQNGQLRPTPEKAPDLYKQSALGLIPKEWEALPAEAVCESVIDCKNRTPPERTTGFPVIRTPNVRNGRFVYSDLLFTDRKSYEIWTQRGAPRPGDIVITREAPVGEVCKIPTTMKQACLGQRMMMYQPDPSIILTDYMLAALVSRRVQNRLLDLAGGSTVGHVKVGDIRQLSIPTPPVCEQTLIAESFNSIESRLRNEAHELEKLRLEKSGLMDDLLTGRVRVTSLLKGAV